MSAIEPWPLGKAVYFVLAGSHLKIGWARNVRSRLQNLQVACPLELQLLAVAKGSIEEERALHERFQHLRVRRRGEWFAYVPELQAYVERVRAEDYRPQSIQERSCIRCGVDFLPGLLESAASRCERCRYCECGTYLNRAQQIQCLRCRRKRIEETKAAAAANRKKRAPKKIARECIQCGAPTLGTRCRACAIECMRKRCNICAGQLGQDNRSGICGVCWPDYFAKLSHQERRAKGFLRGPVAAAQTGQANV